MKVEVRTTRKHKRLRKNLLDHDLDIDSARIIALYLFALWLFWLVEVPISEDGQIHKRKDHQLDLIR